MVSWPAGKSFGSGHNMVFVGLSQPAGDMKERMLDHSTIVATIGVMV